MRRLLIWFKKSKKYAFIIFSIEENGVTIIYNNGGGQQGQKKNDCVPELYRISAQMLKLLSELGLRGADVKAVDVDEAL